MVVSSNGSWSPRIDWFLKRSFELLPLSSFEKKEQFVDSYEQKHVFINPNCLFRNKKIDCFINVEISKESFR